MSTERITRREMLKRLIVAPVGATLLTMREAEAVKMGYLQRPEPHFGIILWAGHTECDMRWRNLTGETVTITPTVQRTTPYDRLWWTGYTLSSVPVSVMVRVMARSVDLTGVPLGPGWKLLRQDTIPARRMEWFHLDIPEGHWDEYRIEVRSEVSCQIYSRVMANLPIVPKGIEPVQAHTLLIHSLSIDTTPSRDLLARTLIELPTLDTCGAYRKLIWTYFRTGEAHTTYTILARVTDHNGAPLGSGWLPLASQVVLPGGANEWGRIEIPSIGDAYYDQYRITVQRETGSSYELSNKIVGVRGWHGYA